MSVNLMMKKFQLFYLLLLSAILPGCSESIVSLSVEHGQSVTFKNSGIELQLDKNMYSTVTFKKEGELLSLNKVEKTDSGRLPSFYLVTDKGIVKNFKIDFSKIIYEEINGVFGKGKRLLLKGISTDIQNIVIENNLSIELYREFPNTAIVYSEFKNISETGEVQLEEVFSSSYQLDAKNVNKSVSSHSFYSFYGTDGRILRQKEKILPSKFDAVNYTGRPDSLEGIKEGNGGIPLVDIWCKEAGIGIGHIETKWKNLYLPIKVQENGKVFIAIREIPNINLTTPFILKPGESFKTIKSFVKMHSLDFYGTVETYSEIMRRQGYDFHTLSTDNDYLSAWCSWNDFSTHAMASKNDVMLIKPILRRLPELKKLKIYEIIFDAGWFNNQGDWMPNSDSLSFPGGEQDFISAINNIHNAGIKIKLWISYLTADPWSEVGIAHPEWMILKKDGSFHLDRWSGYTMCPSLPEVQQYHQNMANRFVNKYGADGFKVDGMYVCPPCYNPAHRHKNPNESSEDYYKVFKSFFEEAKLLNNNITIMSCPCGSICDFTSLPYITQTIAADPKTYETVRRKAKLYRALKGSDIPYSSDYVDITKGNLQFPISLANAVGIGAVPQTFYGKTPNSDTIAIYQNWFEIYSREMISKASYLNLYDMSFDKPETHVFRKKINDNEFFYYSFFADESEWKGKIEFRGLDQYKNYIIYDYVNDIQLGVIEGSNPVMNLHFKDYLFVKCYEK